MVIYLDHIYTKQLTNGKSSKKSSKNFVEKSLENRLSIFRAKQMALFGRKCDDFFANKNILRKGLSLS